MSKKKSFLLYHDYREHLSLISDEERGVLLMALFDYSEYGIQPTLEGASKMAFSFIKAQMDRDAASYEKKCKANRENGLKGGRPRENPD